MSDSLPLRAAAYFGMQREPRTSIMVNGNKACYLVGDRMGRKVLAFYDESGSQPRGSYTLLTSRQRDTLLAALSEEGR